MRRPAPIQLLGHGLDAITAPATQPRAFWERVLGLRATQRADLLRPVTVQDRIDRYRDAAMIRPLFRDPMLEGMREVRGWAYLKSWRLGRFPRILRLRHLVPVPTPATTKRRAAGARG